MNWSKCPIVFKGKQYHSISDCIKQTGCSRYVIKKNMTYVNQTDLNKFSNFGKKPNDFKTKPSKQKLESLYTGNIRELARKFSVSEKKIIDLLNEYNISLISLSDAKILKNDFKKPSRKILKEIYDNNSLLATANHFKIGISKLKRWLSIDNISIRTLSQSHSTKNKKRRKDSKPSKQELKEKYKHLTTYELALFYGVCKSIIRAWFEEYNIKPKRQESKSENKLFEFCYSIDNSFVKNDRTVIAPLELDIVSHKHKLAIEYCGSYWHSTAVKKNKKYHQQKFELCAKKGYTLLTIFDYDQAHKVHALIKRKLFQKSNRVFARKTTIKQISNLQAKEFNLKQHLNNHVDAKISYGLFFDSTLVMIGTFGKSRYNKNYEYECLRITSHSDYSVIGGVSKIFKNFFRDFKVNSCITYADLRFGDGSSYINCGFKRLKNTNPNYFYLVNGMLFSRVKFQKHKLKTLFPDNYSNEKTEEQIMNNVGYHRIYDCGNAVYVYTKKEP